MIETRGRLIIDNTSIFKKSNRIVILRNDFPDTSTRYI